MTTDTSLAEDKATTDDAMPMRGLRLLGTMGRNDAPEALLLLGQDVLRVSLGDMAGRLEILAIEPGRVTLNDRGTTRQLVVPGGG